MDDINASATGKSSAEITDIIETIKPGYKTSEFKGKCIVQLLVTLASGAYLGHYGHKISPELQATVVGMAGLLITYAETEYGKVRAQVKTAPQK